MNPIFIDIHTHLCIPEAGIKKICTHLLGRDNPLPESDFVAGVHPWDTGNVSGNTLDFFNNPPAGLIGIGEIGLDFTRTETNKDLQVKWLENQLRIAEGLKLPVVLHCVKAYNEIIPILNKYKLKAVLFHGFTGSPELAEGLIKQGYYLSFGNRTSKSPKTIEALGSTPLERIFLETDDDPKADIQSLYMETAKLKGISVNELKEVIFDNYRTIF